MINKNSIGIILIIIAILIGGILIFKNFSISQVEILTDKIEYKQGENLKLKIENRLKENICFSSCYPYSFEKKENEEWNDYKYRECQSENLNQKCLGSKDVTAFEIPLIIDGGIHRIAVPACIGCSFNEIFQENKRFYSNQFIVK